MIIFPAVDIKGGKAVRLRRGRADEETVFNPDPVDAALHWKQAGAEYLHIIDLDGAFDGHGVNLPMIGRIAVETGLPVQVGGGIRDAATAKAYLDAGVTRCIIGTMALEDPAAYADLCRSHPGQIGVSLDAEGGRLKTKGWVADSGLTMDEVLPRLLDSGTAFIIYTDIDRDGMQSGVNLPALAKLARQSTAPVIAAGGVASLDDIKALYPLSKEANLQGAITGRAIYEGSLDLAEAMAWIKSQA